MLLLTGEISNHGWNLNYLLLGAAIGIVGATLMFIYQEVLDEREAKGDDDE